MAPRNGQMYLPVDRLQNSGSTPTYTQIQTNTLSGRREQAPSVITFEEYYLRQLSLKDDTLKVPVYTFAYVQHEISSSSMQ